MKKLLLVLALALPLLAACGGGGSKVPVTAAYCDYLWDKYVPGGTLTDWAILKSQNSGNSGTIGAKFKECDAIGWVP